MVNFAVWWDGDLLREPLDKAVIAKFTAGLGVAMSSTLNLTVGLTNNYNSKAPAGTKKNDAGLFMGVNVKLGAN